MCLFQTLTHIFYINATYSAKYYVHAYQASPHVHMYILYAWVASVNMQPLNLTDEERCSTRQAAKHREREWTKPAIACSLFCGRHKLNAHEATLTGRVLLISTFFPFSKTKQWSTHILRQAAKLFRKKDKKGFNFGATILRGWITSRRRPQCSTTHRGFLYVVRTDSQSVRLKNGAEEWRECSSLSHTLQNSCLRNWQLLPCLGIPWELRWMMTHILDAWRREEGCRRGKKKKICMVASGWGGEKETLIFLSI